MGVISALEESTNQCNNNEAFPDSLGRIRRSQCLGSWDHVQPSRALTLFLCSVLRYAAPLGSEFLEGRVISYSTLYSQCLV